MNHCVNPMFHSHMKHIHSRMKYIALDDHFIREQELMNCLFSLKINKFFHITYFMNSFIHSKLRSRLESLVEISSCEGIMKE